MASPDLRRLWKLHLIDAAIIEIRNRAAALDVGKKLTAEIDELGNQIAGHPYKKLLSDQQDAELTQRSLDDKIAKFDRELYSGKIVNPREVEGYEKELVILRKQKAELEEKILEIWEAIPPERVPFEKLERTLVEKKVALAETQKKAIAVKAQLEADFKSKSAQRPEVAKDQNPTLIAKYEQIRKNHQGVGMAEVIRKRQCGACGTLLPERTLQGCLDDRTMSCETCHRILYYTDGVV